MINKALLILVTFMCLISTKEASRILAVIPIAATSHQNVFRPILTELARRGHYVVAYTPLPLAEVNYTQVKVKNSFHVWNERPENTDEKEQLERFKRNAAITHSPFMRDITFTMMEYVIQDPEFKKLVHSNQEFDLILLASAYFQECFIALGHRFKSPVVDIHPAPNMLWAHWVQGSPADTTYMMDFTKQYTDEMNFYGRLENTFSFIVTKALWWFYHIPKYQSIMDEHLTYPGWEKRPPIMDMIRDVSLVLINTSPVLNYPFPMASHFKDIGGINIRPPKALPQDLQEFMDNAKDGVIYFSLGSHIPTSKTLGTLKNEFAMAFKKVKQRVIWKWDTEFSDISENVLVRNWLPQQSLLAHKNMKIFISHGGFLSMAETMTFGVPIIGIPIIGDQQKNIVHMKKYGYGVHLAFENVTESSITWAINEVLHHPKYLRNAKKKAKLIMDRPLSPLDTAIFWIESVLRHKGAEHLKPSVVKLAWYQESLLDVYLVLIFVTIILPAYIIYTIITFILKKCSSNNIKGTKIIKKRQ